ncbi:secreted ookinete, partial [Cystoisospora suis]
MKIFVATAVAAVMGTANGLNLRSSTELILNTGPYATIVDVHKGTACLLDESRAGNEPAPPECACSFSRLAAMKEKCAALTSTATAAEAKECANIPCEVCCVMRIKTLRATSVPSLGQDCKKKCPNSEQVLEVTEDVSVPVFRAMMDLTDVNFPPTPAAPTALGVPQPATGSVTLPSGSVISGAPQAPALPTEASYPILRLPSEEDLTTTQPASPHELDAISRANNNVIAQTP